VTSTECQTLIDAYVEWLRNGLTAEPVGDACELTTPFLDRHNDHVQVYAERTNGRIQLTDDGHTLSDLRTSGFQLDTPKRRQVFENTLNGFGVRAQSGELVVDASERTLGQRTHTLIQAMLAINDMFVLAQPRVASFFLEDVKGFLDQNEVRYSERIKIAGRTGFDHLVEFLIPPSRQAPERFVQAVNMPIRSSVSAYLFSVTDILEARGNETKAYAFLNDRDREVPGDVIEALDAYSVTAALWSERDAHVSMLAA
jgi:hypothetical protein